MKPPIKDNPEEPKKDKPKLLLCTHSRKSPLKGNNLSTKDKTAGPESVLIKCSSIWLHAGKDLFTPLVILCVSTLGPAIFRKVKGSSTVCKRVFFS